MTLPVVEGATLIAESSTNVESGKSFAFTLTLKDGYSAPQLTVKANGSVLGPVSSGRYVIEKVTSNIVVTVTGIVKDNPTDNAEVDPMACEYGERMGDCISRLLLWTQLVSLHSKGVCIGTYLCL